MKIRPIKPGHITNCPWCKVEGNKVLATWHLTGENMQSCDVHKQMLQERHDKLAALYKPSENCSEADYQTWLKL